MLQKQLSHATISLNQVLRGDAFFQPVLTREHVWRILECPADELRARSWELVNTPGGFARQIKGLWDTIRVFENLLFRQNRQAGQHGTLSLLLEQIDRFRPADPKYVPNETARLWLARYFFQRSERIWRVSKVNIVRLTFKLFGWKCRTNFHIRAIHQDQRGDVESFGYITHKTQWTEPRITATLSMMRCYMDSRTQQHLFPPHHDYFYWCLETGEEIFLTDERHHWFLTEMKFRLEIIVDELTRRESAAGGQ